MPASAFRTRLIALQRFRHGDRRFALVTGGVALAHLVIFALTLVNLTVPVSATALQTLEVSLMSGPPGGAAGAPDAASLPPTPDAVPPPPEPTSTPPPPPEPPEPPPLDLTAEPSTITPPMPTPGDNGALFAAMIPGAGSDCELAGFLQTSFQANPRVLAALERVPRDHRSVAGAIMVWDRGWIDPAGQDGASTLEAVRTVLVDHLATVPPTCLNQRMDGPRLIVLQEVEGPIILAFGSGEWTWGEVVATDFALQ